MTTTPTISPYKHKHLINVYILKFHNESDFHKVKDFKPWFVNRDVVVLKKIPITGIPKDESLSLTHELFWLQAIDVPIEYISVQGITRVVQPAGVYQKHDPAFGTNMLEKNVMIQVMVDLKKKVARKMVAVTEDKEKTIIKFEYGQLPLFCNVCQIIDHPSQQCEGSNKWVNPNLKKEGEGSGTKRSTIFSEKKNEIESGGGQEKQNFGPPKRDVLMLKSRVGNKGRGGVVVFTQHEVTEKKNGSQEKQNSAAPFQDTLMLENTNLIMEEGAANSMIREEQNKVQIEDKKKECHVPTIAAETQITSTKRVLESITKHF